MKKSMKLDSIYKNVAIFGNILVKHRVHIFSVDKLGMCAEYSSKFTSSKSKAGKMGYPSVNFKSTDDSIILENIPKDSKTDKIRNSVYLSYTDLSEVIRVFKESTEWFDKYKNDLFEYDKNNIPYGINQKYSNLHAIMRIKVGLKGTFLAIQPAVILDSMNSSGYPGIIMKTATGYIGSCTLTEFFSLQQIVVNMMKNLYQISNDLINQYLLTEAGGINGWIYKRDKWGSH